MKHLNYQTLQTMANYCAYWIYELNRNMEILREPDFRYSPGAEYQTAWLNAHRATLETRNMHLSDAERITREMSRRRKLVGWM